MFNFKIQLNKCCSFWYFAVDSWTYDAPYWHGKKQEFVCNIKHTDRCIVPTPITHFLLPIFPARRTPNAEACFIALAAAWRVLRVMHILYLLRWWYFSARIHKWHIWRKKISSKSTRHERNVSATYNHLGFMRYYIIHHNQST